MLLILCDATHTHTHTAIHRLDRMTSGVLLLAKSTAIATRFMKELQQGAMHKTYVARVVGCFPEFVIVLLSFSFLIAMC